jgi:hypothetical protein
MNNLVRFVVIVGIAAFAVVLVALGLARHDADLIAPVNLALFVLAILAYMLPTGLALYRDCRSTAGIVVVNLLLGWTILGWFAALGWAASGRVKPRRHMLSATPTYPSPGR